MIEYIKNKYRSDLQEIEQHEPWNERLKRNLMVYYDRLLKTGTFTAITRQECEKLKELRLDKIVFDWQALDSDIDNELMEKMV